MKIDGWNIDHDQVMIIADFLSDCDVCIASMPCHYCGRLLSVQERTLMLVSQGSKLCCISCAMRFHPDTVVGRDPDTGNYLTVREMARYPNIIGGFRNEDLKE